MSMRLATVIPLTALFLAGCGIGDWFSPREQPPLPGERIPVLELARGIGDDVLLRGAEVRIPPVDTVTDWSQPGRTASNQGGHPALSASPSLAWRVDIGDGGNRLERRILSTPVVADGMVYAIDARLRVSAYDAASGSRIWRVDLRPDDERDGFGGGLSYGDGRIYAATGFGHLFALDARSGEEIWRQSQPGPIRTAPTFADGQLYVLAVDNRVAAIDAESGRTLWSYPGVAESASLLGSASPVVTRDTVIAPLSSGDLVALRVLNGRSVWNESLAAPRRFGSAMALSDIRGMPAVVDGRVFAMSHASRAAAIDIRSGGRIWERAYGGINTPWAAGNHFWFVSNDNELAAVRLDDGRIPWVQPLQRYGNPDRQRDPLIWFGPVLAGERLVLTRSDGRLFFMSPFDGTEISEISLPGPTGLPPVVAGGTVYTLSTNGTLSAFR